MRTTSVIIFALTGGLAAASGCSSNTTPKAIGAFSTTAAVSGPGDNHCSGQSLGVSDPAACLAPKAGGDAAGEGGAASDSNSGVAAVGAPEGGGDAATDCNSTHDPDYGDTLYNSEGDDDDCKYRVAWTSTAVALNTDVTFQVTATTKKDGSPLEGLTAGSDALSRVELYLPCDSTHFPPAQDFKATFNETAPGVYAAGPFQFDKSGRWVVRFHFYEQCIDQPDSPHGHAAFFIDVP